MPNNVINEIILHGVKLNDCRQHLFDKSGAFSFNVLLPLPINFWAGSVSQSHEKAFPGTHLAAARQMWGTKWDAYGDPTAKDSENGLIIRFESAWSHPRGWVVALFNTMQADITASWLSEGGFAAHVEQYRVGDQFGPTWEDTEIEDGSPEHRRLHKLLWGVEEFEDEDEDVDHPETIERSER